MQPIVYLIYTAVPLVGMLLFLASVSNEYHRGAIYFDARQARIHREHRRSKQLAGEVERRRQRESELGLLLGQFNRKTNSK